MTDFEKYAFVKAYNRYLTTLLKRKDTEIGVLNSEIEELKYVPNPTVEAYEKEIRDLKAHVKDLLFKNNKLLSEIKMLSPSRYKKHVKE